MIGKTYKTDALVLIVELPKEISTVNIKHLA